MKGHRHDCGMKTCYCRPYIRYLCLDDLGHEFDLGVIAILNEPENKPALQRALHPLLTDLVRPIVREVLREIAKGDRQKLSDWILDLIGPQLDEVYQQLHPGPAFPVIAGGQDDAE